MSHSQNGCSGLENDSSTKIEFDQRLGGVDQERGLFERRSAHQTHRVVRHAPGFERQADRISVHVVVGIHIVKKRDGIDTERDVIDRDPESFAVVLDFLRRGSRLLPPATCWTFCGAALGYLRRPGGLASAVPVGCTFATMLHSTA